MVDVTVDVRVVVLDVVGVVVPDDVTVLVLVDVADVVGVDVADVVLVDDCEVVWDVVAVLVAVVVNSQSFRLPTTLSVIRALRVSTWPEQSAALRTNRKPWKPHAKSCVLFPPADS